MFSIVLPATIVLHRKMEEVRPILKMPPPLLPAAPTVQVFPETVLLKMANLDSDAPPLK